MLEDLAGRGVAVVVATRDAALRPEIGRGWGPHPSPDGSRLDLCVEAAEASRMHANLRPGAPLAVTITRLSSRDRITVIGRVRTVSAPDAERAAAVRAHVVAFAEELVAIGARSEIAGALLAPDLLDVVIDVAGLEDAT